MNKAINKWVLIDKINETVKTKSGLTMTGSGVASMRYGKGVLLSAGPMFEHIPVGSTVYYDSSRAHEILLDGQWHTVLRGEDIVIYDEESTDDKEPKGKEG